MGLRGSAAQTREGRRAQGAEAALRGIRADVQRKCEGYLLRYLPSCENKLREQKKNIFQRKIP